MMQAQVLAPPGDVVTSWNQLCERYPDQWVVLVETDWTDRSMVELRSARVIGHGPHRKEVLAEALAVTARYRRFGCFFTGRIRAPLLGFFAPR